ncbi:hypothetical protein JAAARDRAFT_112068, partial [Jaapia argillacea MUCL 33604]
SETCECQNCQIKGTRTGCENPHKCFVKVRDLLDTLPPKWSPYGNKPEDNEGLVGEDMPEEEGWSIFDPWVTTHGGLTDLFRIFT